MKKDIIIHIGLHKTGTTFLQAMVFPELKNIFARSLHMLPKSESSPFNQILTGKFADMNAQELEYLKRDIYNYVDSSVNDSNIILSREDLTCHFHWEYNQEKNEKIFNTLKEFFPDAEFFFVIRKQDSWINSMYAQVRKYSHLAFLNLNEFIGYKNGKFIENKKYLDIQNVDWNKIIEFVEHKFGKENIYILPYEMFKENPKKFLKRFYEHYNIESYYPENNEIINKRQACFSSTLYSKYLYYRYKMPAKMQKILEKNDKGFLKWSQNINIKVKIPKLSKKQAKQVMEIHKENNKKLAEYIGMDLSQYGYY